MTLAIVTAEGLRKCGFCQSNHHGRCAVGTRVVGPPKKYPNGAVILCGCTDGGCEPGRRKCTYCNNRKTEEVSPETWECLDLDACRETVEQRRRANPLYNDLREAKERATMAKTEATKTKAVKTAKTGTCLVTGKTTKGGLFLPGMDARYVSERVADVQGKVRTEAQARKQMKDDGVSEKLVAKFEKSLGIAKEKVAKKAADDKAKADAKAEKAAEAKAAKAEKAAAK